MNAVLTSLEPYVTRHRARPAVAPGWQALREEAMERAAACGFPADHDENWKYTSIRPLVQRAFGPAGHVAIPATAALKPYLIPHFDAARLVLVNGCWAPSLSAERAGMPARVTVLNSGLHAAQPELRDMLRLPEAWSKDVFANLNTAFAEDVLLLELPANAQPEHAVEILHLSLAGVPASHHVRIVLRLGSGARLQLVERYAGEDSTAHFTNTLMQIELGEHATLEHVRLQTESATGFHVGRVLVAQAAGSRYVSHNLQLGGYWVRLDLHTRLAAPGAQTMLNGLYAVNGRRHVDNHTRIDHAAAGTISNELYHGLLDGASRAVFNGKIVVAPHAVKADAGQTNRNLLLSRGAEIDTKPELEIYADDVKCSHGASVGQLDENQLFYLRSRGLDEQAARGLLVGAFANALIRRLPASALRAVSRHALGRVLNHLPLPEEA